MIICTYCSQNYKPCLDITLPTWKTDRVIVYSDTEEFGIKMFEPSDDFNESCRRKIQIIKRTLSENPGENVLYLDADVFMVAPVDEVFNIPSDIIATRMIRRVDREYYKEVNAGVSFWRANSNAIKFCDEWLNLEYEYSKNSTIKLPEQYAFNTLCFLGYDKQTPWSVSNVSEYVYNYERDTTDDFIRYLKVYKPKLIHLKKKRWLDMASLSEVYRLADELSSVLGE